MGTTIDFNTLVLLHQRMHRHVEALIQTRQSGSNELTEQLVMLDGMHRETLALLHALRG